MVYGTGQFFEELAPQLISIGVDIECLIDTKAEKGEYIVNSIK